MCVQLTNRMQMKQIIEHGETYNAKCLQSVKLLRPKITINAIDVNIPMRIDNEPRIDASLQNYIKEQKSVILIEFHGIQTKHQIPMI